VLKRVAMTPLSSPPSEVEPDAADRPPAGEPVDPECYSLTLFTHHWKAVRNFYVEILTATVLSEREGRSCQMEMGGLPLNIRQCENGEMVTFLHLYVAIKDRESVLTKLRNRGIIVTCVGPYCNFRDPEGRVIKLSEAKTTIS